MEKGAQPQLTAVAATPRGGKLEPRKEKGKSAITDGEHAEEEKDVVGATPS